MIRTAFPKRSFRLALGATALAAMAGAAAADQVILDDLIVDGSICAGLDCVNGESFGFDTLRLKENNLRVRFQDTSSSASFPTVDWQLVANDSSNGGQNRFSIEDVDNSRVPFTVEAGAPSNSLYVDDGGRIGLGTATPVVEVHVKDGDTPTLRLEQDGSSGFTAQIWDVAGNETNWFVRDATTGSQLPLRIRPAAPTNSIFVDTDGDIGLGTAMPDGPLHIAANSAYITLSDDDNGDTWYITHQAGDNGDFEFTSVLDGSTVNLAMSVQPDGDMIIDGTLTENSDKNAKMAIEPVDPAEVLEKVAALPITSWSYIDDAQGARHMGPMAQDFHAAFGLGADDTGISTLDTTGVALAAIQALRAENRELRAEIETLKALVAR